MRRFLWRPSSVSLLALGSYSECAVADRRWGSIPTCWRKRTTLIEHHHKNPSLELLIKQLGTLQSRLTANDPAASQEHGDAAPPSLDAHGGETG